MRGKTLAEKRFGPGIRPGLLRRLRAPWPGCAAETTFGHPCPDPIAGSVEVYVDAPPPGVDWYTRMLRRMPVGAWVRVSLCLSHLEGAMKRSVQVQEEADSWEPGRENPYVLINPPKVFPEVAAMKGWET